MSIIVNATKRLEELRRAGVSVPWASADAVADPEKPAADASESIPKPAPKQPPVAEVAEPRRQSTSVELDLEQLERSGVIVSSKTRSDIAAQFRHAKRPLLRNVLEAAAADGAAGASGAHRSLLMVTSALPGEGKTFCAINLAMSIAAEIDTSVLLVDADVVRPDLLHRLGVKEGKGLIDLLAEPGLDVADVMLKTNVPKLSLLPAGSRHARSTELLASAAMEALLADLAQRYSDRVIVFDAPPLLVTTEAQVLASHMGQVVVVVEASSTPRQAVEQAFASVAQCPIVMSLLNKCQGTVAAHGYGYGYASYEP